MNTDDLIQRFLDGQASPEEAAELSARIETNVEARNRYLDLAELHAALFADETLRDEKPPVVVSRPKWAWKAPMLKMAAAVVFMLGLIWMLNPASRLEKPMAKLLSTENARWSDAGTELSLNAGEAPSGILRLMEGKAEFLTSLGAVVMLQGPVVMRFESATALFVESGKVLCRCPTAESRLVVRTPQTRVIDLGTEFVVEARADESTRVAVLSGEVKVSSTVLHQGQAAEVRTQGVTMLHSEVVNEMRPHVASPPRAEGTNLLRGGDFSSEADAWETQSPYVEIEDGSLHLRSLGHRSWPNARQRLWNEASGRVVTASARAMQPKDDPLRQQQFAVLKLVFVGEGGRQIAYASRHFQFAGEEPGVFQRATITAIPPLGTKGIHLELLLNAQGDENGSVIFDDAVLHVGEVAKEVAP